MQSHNHLAQIIAAIDAQANRAGSRDPDHRAIVSAEIIRMAGGARAISPLLARDFLDREEIDD